VAEAYFNKVNKNKKIRVKSAGLIKGKPLDKDELKIAKKFNLNINGKPKGLDYKILDKTSDYNPDIIGDIHSLPFLDNSQDAIVCISVLEHVEDPIKASREIFRALKPNGYCFVYIPFLFYYHAEKGYYKDYWRFTKDSIDLLFKDFSTIERQNVRGAVATWLRNSPFGRINAVSWLADVFDKVIGKTTTNQTSGYSVFLIK